ncbi:cytochrome P450 6a2-like [Ceratina calcarata]|uniref:Cytochrome P450 6a2-like n=1 Tax=Ceratina calcarata TaxID=156304 RepID=A0AAJ7J585_9HYME|nr:cytochrome P450 6a2-like [Ceratina calcarata]
MASIFLTLFAGAVALLCFYLYLRFTYWKRNGIPTARGCYPIVGHVLPVLSNKKSFNDMVQEIYNEYPDCSMVGIYRTIRPALIIRDPNLVKTVMQSNFSNFHTNGLHIEADADPLFAKNPFFSEGEVWSTERKRLTYAFSSSKLKSLFVTVTGVCEKFKNYLNRRLSSNDKYEVELKYLFSKFTGEVVANAALGIEGRCFEDKDDPNAFDQIGHSFFKPTKLEKFFSQCIFLLPELNHLLKIRFVPKQLDQLFRKIVEKNMEIRRKEPAPRNDFLQLMIDLEKTGEALDLEAVTAHAFSFYADGFETSSTTLSFIGYQLATHQDVQDRLRNEVKTVIEKHGGALTYEGLKEMTYMDQVINESQRCYVALTILNKECSESFVLEGSDGLRCHVKPGTQILIPIQALQLDPKYWPDPQNFDPERFSEERKGGIKKYTFLPFGEGPRMCVGMRMALMQMKACLATLLKDHKIELSPKTKLPLNVTSIFFFLSPIGGLWVNISKL